MGGRNFTFNRVEDGIPKSGDDDSRMREIFIYFSDKTWNIKYISGTKYGIDCVRTDNPNVGAEGENASWNGDRWVGSQRDIFDLGFDTLNIQNWKWHYWGLGEFSEKNYGKYLTIHPGFMENIYFRINKQEDQICIVDAETIRDFNKIKFVLNRKVSNAKKPEDWICVPKQYVKTYNKQPNGEWVLNGRYCGLSQEEINRNKEEYKNKRAKEILEKK